MRRRPGWTARRGMHMVQADSYSLETRTKTRNLGLVMSLILVPIMLAFMYLDHSSPMLRGILGWRIGATVPGLVFFAYALFLYPKHPGAAVGLHIVQMTGLMVMMCGISADLSTRPDLPSFARTGLISSLIVCVFVDFVFAAGARKYLFAILLPPLAAMGVYVAVAGHFLTQTEQVWLISNPSALAVGLSILALYQERSSVKQFRARLDLDGAERTYRDLFENAQVGMFRTRIDGSEILDVNRRLLEISGRTREEMIGSMPKSLWADPGERAEMRRLLLRDGAITNFECRLLDAHGTRHTCLLSMKAYPARGILEGSLVDITEHKQAGQWMEVLKHSIDSAVDGAYWLSEGGNIVYANASGCTALGYTHQEMLSMFIWDIAPIVDRQRWATMWTRLKELKTGSGEFQHRRKDGSLFPAEISTSYVRFGDQEFAVGFAHDITERKRLEAERLDLERRVASSQKLEGLGILAGGVAHNFNNLLTVILGHAELLRETVPSELDTAASVQEIIRAGSRSRDLIGQLLALGRKQVLELRPLDLNSVVRECSSMLRQAIRENIAIEYRLSDSPCPVAADPGRLEEVLLNLALNAQDAIPREGRLCIETREAVLEGAFARRHDDAPPGHYVLLTVSDTGAGMDERTVAKIFDPFFTTKEQGKGTGLGLSTVYGIVKQHEGSIEVESRPGTGTRFLIYLPRSTAARQDAAPPQAERTARGNETVLLVEDEEPIRTLLSRNLRGLGYTVLEAEDGLEALRISEGHADRFHILVTDVVMPRMNGTELHERLREKMPDLKVLFISGHKRDVISSHITQNVELMTKPFTGLALAFRVREILDRYGAAGSQQCGELRRTVAEGFRRRQQAQDEKRAGRKIVEVPGMDQYAVLREKSNRQLLVGLLVGDLHQRIPPALPFQDAAPGNPRHALQERPAIVLEASVDLVLQRGAQAEDRGGGVLHGGGNREKCVGDKRQPFPGLRGQTARTIHVDPAQLQLGEPDQL